MNTIFTSLAAIALAVLVGMGAAAKESVIGLSPHLPKEVKERLIRDVVAYVGATLARGETAYIVDAANQTLIGAFTVPDRDGYDGVKARIKVNRKAVGGLKAYAAAELAEPSGRIDLAAFLRHVGATYPAETARELFVIGSPLAHDDRTPDFSMLDGAVPNDAHLLASRSQTPYGAIEDAGRLANYRGHFGLAGPAWAVSDAHAFAVERLIALSFTLRGARYVGATTSAAAAFRNAMTEALPEATFEAEPSEELLMIRYKVEARAEAVEPAPVGSIYERPLSEEAPAAERLAQAENAEIAIRWTDCATCDLDLAAWPAGATAPIFYSNAATAEGRLIKDHTSSPAANGWEQIIFDVPVDLRSLVVAINFYSGSSPGGAKGEIRVAIGGETWGRSFRIPAGQGNGGAGRDATLMRRSPASPAWTVINAAAVTGG